jgi:polysaccharide biosynthesis transport protein
MDHKQVFLRDVLTVLFKRKLFILLFVAVVFALVFAGNYVWPPTYESVAKVQILRGRETTGVDPSLLEGSAMPMVQMTYFDVNTVIDLVYSNDVLLNVARQTNFDQSLAGGPLGMLRGGLNRLQYALKFKAPGDPDQRRADELREAIRVEPVKDAYVLDIRVTMPAPELARTVLTTLIAEFEKKHKEVYSTEKLEPFFRTQLERAEKDLIAAQEKLRAFRNDNNVMEMEVERETLASDFSKGQRLLDQLEGVEDAVAGADDEAAIAVLSRQTESTVVTELQLRLLDKIVERNRITQSLGPNHPQVLGINQEVDRLNTRLREAIAATRQITAAKQDEILAQMTKVNNMIGELDNLTRDETLAADSYEYYKKKLEEARVYDEMGQQGISSIRVTSTPSLPDNPASPKRLLNLFLALLGGIIGGTALAFFLEYLDHGLKTPEDVEYFVKVPTLASFFRGPYEQADPKEAMRLSARLDSFGPLHERMRFITVASSVGGEGALPVARAIAETNSDDPETKTLFIDFVGDGVGERPGSRGIFEVLDGEVAFGDAVSRMGNLCVIGRGGRKEIPSYLWTSERMRTFLDNLRREYDRVVVHVPPILQAQDAIHMVRQSDGVLLVIRADSTRREVVQRAMDTLGDARTKIVGAVLTGRTQVIPKAVYRRI